MEEAEAVAEASRKASGERKKPPVRKPHRQEWIRVNADPAYRGNYGTICLKEEKDEHYLVHPDLVVELEEELRRQGGLAGVSDELLRRAKRAGFSDRQLSTIWSTAEMDIRTERKRRRAETLSS